MLYCLGVAQVDGYEMTDISPKPPKHHEQAEAILQRAQSFGFYHDSSLYYLTELQVVADREVLPYYAIQAHYLSGKHYLLKLQTSLARQHFRQAERLAAAYNEYELQGFASDRIGLTLLEEGMIDSAFLAFQNSYTVYKNHGLSHRLWAPLQGMSTVFKRHGDYALAKRYGDEALASIDAIDEPVGKAILLNHMLTTTRLFRKIHDYAFYYDQYVEILGPRTFNEDNQHKIAYYVITEDPIERLKDIQAAIEELGPVPRISTIHSYHHLGNTYLELGQWQQAANAFTQGLKLNEMVPSSIAFRHVLYDGLTEAYTAMENHKEAMYWLRKKLHSEDSIARGVNISLINELQIKYETAQKEQRILTQELALQQRTQQRNLILATSVLFALLSAGLFFLFRYRLRLQRTIAQQQSRLQQQQIQELENRNKLDSLTSMITGQEEERKRLANDIHDGLGGLLATVKIQFDRVGELLHDSKAIAEFNRSRNLLEETTNEMRRIAHNMIPHALMKMGLLPALEDLANNIQSANGLRVSLKSIDIASQLSTEKEVVLYRIVQELCSNAIKHANATRLLIQISQHNGTYSLVVEDNGKGFTSDESIQSGLGMESIASRVAYLNGSVDVDSTDGKGTSVTIEFPVQ